MNSRILGVVTVSHFLLVVAGILPAQEFDIDWHSIDSGSGYSASNSFELNGTLGQADASESMAGGGFLLKGGFWVGNRENAVLLGDVNGDGVANLLDVAPFVQAIVDGTFIPNADINNDGAVNLLDVELFVDILTG